MLRVPHEGEELAFPCPCPDCLDGRRQERNAGMTVWDEVRYVLTMAVFIILAAATDVWSAIRRAGG